MSIQILATTIEPSNGSRHVSNAYLKSTMPHPLAQSLKRPDFIEHHAADHDLEIAVEI
jgi:hypothetical protein